MEGKDILTVLVETNDVRIEESLTRPRVEMLADEDAAWRAWHRAKDLGAEPVVHFGIGWV